MPEEPQVQIWTDGSCLKPGGAGAAAALVRFPCPGQEPSELVVQKAFRSTTNQRMELMAAIIALEEVGGRGVVVEVTTDSKYLQLGITEWITSWKARGWRNANNKPVANRDLWERLEKLVEPHNITWHHVRGHRGHVENERVDKIAGIAARANPTDVDVGFEKSA